jgi:hypothetical protein
MQDRLNCNAAADFAMKTMTLLAATLALLTTPALAQMGGSKHGRSDTKKAEQKRPAVDENAYKAALEKIPEPKGKYDPWGEMRPVPPAKKPN